MIINLVSIDGTLVENLLVVIKPFQVQLRMQCLQLTTNSLGE